MAQDGLALPLESGLSVLEEPGFLRRLEIPAITTAGNAFARLDEREIHASGRDSSGAPMIAAVKATASLECQTRRGPDRPEKPRGIGALGRWVVGRTY